MVTRSEPGYVWDFCGGELSIDFTNTIGSRGGEAREHLGTYADLVSWAETRGVLGRAEARRLRQEAAKAPAAARDALAAAIALREALYRTIAAAAAGHKPTPSDLAQINAHVEASFAGAHLEPSKGRLALAFDAPRHSRLAEHILTPVVRAAVDLLTSGALARVRLCADASCGWLFLDTTRNRTRRWCDMKECGNRNKVRRFREAQA